MEKSIRDIVEDGYKIAIPYVNGRVTASFYDGLKNVQRRVIFTLMKSSTSSTTKLTGIIGECMAKYHPHGDSIEDVIVDLVNKGILMGQGNFGAKYLYNNNSSSAAPRYIEAGLTDSFRKLASRMIQYTPKEQSDVSTQMMPTRLILPLPIAILNGCRGIGLASNNNIPAFTAKSVLDALKKDDPSLLRSKFGAEIVQSKSTLSKLWNKGHGKITYKMKVYKGEFSGLKGVFMEGSAELFGKINLSPFRKALKEDLIVIKDLGNRVFIGKQFNVRKIDVPWIYERCISISEMSDIYMITLIKDGVVGRYSLKYWLNYVYNEYLDYYRKFISDEIADRNKEILLLTHLKSIGELLIAGKSDEEILKSLPEINSKILSTAQKKSLNMLRADHSKTIKRLKSEIEDLRSKDVDSEVDKLIRSL